MASLGSTLLSRACVMHFSHPVLAIFHHLLPIKVLNYRETDYPGHGILLLQNVIRCNKLVLWS